MKSVNPLHIIALLVVFLLFIFIQLSGAKTELLEAKETYAETLSLSTKLKGLQEVYADKNSVKKSINILLRQHSLKAAKMKQSIGTSSVTISSESMDKTALNSLMSKILNGSYNVRTCKIKALSERKASFTMEIQW